MFGVIFKYTDKQIEYDKYFNSVAVLPEQIRYYDEVLTMSARMAVFMYSERWIQRYNDAVGPLDNALEKSRKIFLNITDELTKIETANQILIKLELRAITLVRNKEFEKAKDILFSPEYYKNKKDYSDALNNVLASIRISIDEKVKSVQNELRNLIRIVLILLVTIGILGVVIFRFFVKQAKELKSLSVTDQLTGLYNRYKIEETFFYEQKRSQRNNEPLSFIIIDIDHFKLVNDTYGHNIGDFILKEVATTLKDSLRQTDILGRWGGEEFVAIFPNTNLSNAKKIAEKIRSIIENREFTEVHKITASFGVSAMKSNESLKDVFHKADEALYKAKKNGRNRVEVVLLASINH